MRGARTEDNPAPHLLAALDQVRGVVVAQRRVADKSNEIPALPELLAPLDLDGAGPAPRPGQDGADPARAPQLLPCARRCSRRINGTGAHTPPP